MSVRLWSTRRAPEPDFASAWTGRLARAPHAHFAMDLAFLEWEARHGRHALAALVDEGGRAGALVLREAGAGWISGWPWRWQLLIEDPGRLLPAGLTADEAAWLAGHARALAGGRRLKCHLPYEAAPGEPAFPAGTTTLRPVTQSDEEILASLDTNKRRLLKRALREGYTVEEASTPDAMRGFARLQKQAAAARGPWGGTVEGEVPPAGERWREWELPWMWLLLARRDGAPVAGSGFGRRPGGMLDYRANASTLEARRDGANVLLAYEALRRGRDQGHRWMNWGGANSFKREMGGTPVPVRCQLAGGAVWALPNRLDLSLRLARPPFAAWWRRLQRARGGPQA